MPKVFPALLESAVSMLLIAPSGATRTQGKYRLVKDLLQPTIRSPVKVVLSMISQYIWSHNTSTKRVRESEFPCVCCQYPCIKLGQKICENKNTGSPTGNTVEPTGRSCVVPVGRSWWSGSVEKRFKVPSFYQVLSLFSSHWLTA